MVPPVQYTNLPCFVPLKSPLRTAGCENIVYGSGEFRVALSDPGYSGSGRRLMILLLEKEAAQYLWNNQFTHRN